jgi:hypothetical protein
MCINRHFCVLRRSCVLLRHFVVECRQLRLMLPGSLILCRGDGCILRGPQTVDRRLVQPTHIADGLRDLLLDIGPSGVAAEVHV